MGLFKKKAPAPTQFDKESAVDEQKIISDNQHNEMLQFLNSKHIGRWVKESDIENHFKETIASYTVGVYLNRLKAENLVDWSRNMNEYKINTTGRDFIAAGGYK